ncbi:MAG: hypothetical protein HPY71_13310 [Firmicutes bacterium]|nr:hypothetical protein [Bacillota bacterium]
MRREPAEGATTSSLLSGGMVFMELVPHRYAGGGGIFTMKAMSSRERVLCALRRERHDRVPVTPLVGHYAARIFGISIGAYSRSASLLAKSIVAAQRQFGYDAVYVAADTWVNAEAMGCVLTYPEDSPPFGRPIISSSDELKNLRLPDPQRDGRWPLMLRAVELVAKELGNSCCVIGNFDQSPFSFACQLRGVAEFMYDLIDSPQFAFDLLEICAKAVIRYAKAMASAGADVLNTGDAAASGSLIGAEFYERFALPFEQMVFRALADTGCPCVLHICGDSSRILEAMATSGAQGIEVDYQVDVAEATKRVGDKVCIIGNLNPAHIMSETPDRVYEESKSIIEACKAVSGFVFASGCTIAPATPPENVHAMVRAARDWGSLSQPETGISGCALGLTRETRSKERG